jgi:RNA-directed DNA polymerase
MRMPTLRGMWGRLHERGSNRHEHPLVRRGSGHGTSVPTIRDRVVQTAAKIVLEPIFEADLEDNAYGYRPVRGAVDAVSHTDVVDADLSKYFHSIPHSELIKSVARRIVDGQVLRLIKLWLKAPIEEQDGDGKRRMSGGKSNARGTPQGGVASPLLANIYMNRFLKHWRLTGRGDAFRARVVVYADDFVILSRGHAAEALAWTKTVMTRLGLALNEQKTSLKHARQERALRLPRLLVRTSLVQSERPMASGRKPVQEERATVQDKGR